MTWTVCRLLLPPPSSLRRRSTASPGRLLCYCVVAVIAAAFCQPLSLHPQRPSLFTSDRAMLVHTRQLWLGARGVSDVPCPYHELLFELRALLRPVDLTADS